MGGQFDLRQRNNLLIGNNLAVELPASLPTLRAFLSIRAYIPRKEGERRKTISKFLNGSNQAELRYSLWYYEVDRAFLAMYPDDVEPRQLQNALRMENIPSIAELEALIRNFLEDFSLFALHGDKPY